MEVSIPMVVTLKVVHRNKAGGIINVQEHTYDTDSDEVEKIKKIYNSIEEGETKEKLKILLEQLEVL